MPGSILGTRVKRVEDPALITGMGRYVGDVHPEGLAHLAFVRSPIAHGRIAGLDVSAAAAHPGVLAVLTAADLGLAPYHPFFVLNPKCARPPLADGKVRFAGEPIVAVVAETPGAAADAAQLAAQGLDLEPLPAAVDPELALAPDAPLQFEELGSNLAAGQREDGSADPLEGAAVVVRARLQNQRIAVVPMEGNAITVVKGNSSGRMKLRRRSSAGSMPSSSAARSIRRSSISAASGRPAPRKAPMGAVLVRATATSKPMRGIR